MTPGMVPPALRHPRLGRVAPLLPLLLLAAIAIASQQCLVLAENPEAPSWHPKAARHGVGGHRPGQGLIYTLFPSGASSHCP